MRPMNCIIIEDEIPAQNVLKNYIDKLPQLHLLNCFQSGLEANSLLSEQKIDLVFLDINLPLISGIQYIQTVANPPQIIMTTAYPDYAVESFELATIIDYLVKPFSFDRFLKAVNKAKVIGALEAKTVSKKDTERSIFINVDKTLHRVLIEDILFVESDRNYITIVTHLRKYSFIDTLKNWKKILASNGFIQIHKSFLVQHSAIETISGNVLLVHSHQLPIGRSYKAALLQQLHIN